MDNILDSILNFISTKLKKVDITNQIQMVVKTQEANYEVIRQGDRVYMTGYIVAQGQLAAGGYVNMFDVPQELRPSKYVAMSVYTTASCVIGLQSNGKAYLRNDGNKALPAGDTVIFSGSWYIGGGQLLRLPTSFLGRRWQYVYTK